MKSAITQSQIDMLYGHMISTIIEGQIYLSGADAALDKDLLLNVIGITHVVNASNGAIVNKFDNHLLYYNINIEDKDDQDIIEYFDKVNDFLRNQYEHGDKVLFHCVQGVSRSATLVIAYLMKSKNMSLKEAFELAKSKRAKVQPNLKFAEALLTYEKQIRSCDDNSMNYYRLTGVRNRPSIAMKADTRTSEMTYETNNPVGPSMRKTSDSPNAESQMNDFVANKSDVQESTAIPTNRYCCIKIC